MTTSQRMSAAAFRAHLSAKPSKKNGRNRENKYSAVKTLRHGITFDSKIEADRYDTLLHWHRAGVIKDLERQVRIILHGANGTPLKSDTGRDLSYVADHTYRVTSTNQHIIEDVKGVKTSAYRLKKAILAQQGITVTEVTTPEQSTF